MTFPHLDWQPWVEPLLPYWKPALRSAIILLLGFFAAVVLSRLFIHPFRHRLSPQARLVIRKSITYGLTLILVVTILREFGFHLTTLLGAAGIIGIAIGFAAQTSLSNIISGFFLLWEKPFQIGDAIRVDGHLGLVESIDLLSLTLRTFDNLSIRIPNETLVKGQIINVTRHPIRRYDIPLGVHYREDVDRVLALLRTIADANPHVLIEPEPLVCFTGFGESQLDFLLGVWHEKDDYIAMRNSILRDIKTRFESEGIEIPFPHRVIVGAALPPAHEPVKSPETTS